MGKKYKLVKCNKCKRNNNIDEAMENNDYDTDSIRNGIGYIYCLECGNQIEFKIK